MSYPLIELEKICTDVYSGGTPSSGNEDYYGGDIPWLRTQEVVFNNIWDTEIRITETGLKNSSAKLVPENSVIVAMYGNSAGRVAVNKIPLTTNQACCNLLINEDLADYRYIFYSLKHNYLALKSQAKGAAQNNLNASQVKGFKVPMPDKNAQIEIANILSKYDDLIENNKRRMELLEESARLLYREWFVHFRFPGHEHVKIIDGLPEGWEPTVFTDLIDVNPTTKAPKTDFITYVPMSALSTSGMTSDSSEFEKRSKSTSVKFQNGDVLLARITPSLENGKTGFVYFLDEGEIGCGSTEFIVLRGKQVSPEFTYCVARSYSLREKAIKSMIGSSGRQRVQVSCFNDFPVPKAPDFIMREFNSTTSKLFRQIKNLVNQNQKLTQARDILLPRLMNGDLAV